MGFAELIASAPTALVALAFGGGLLPGLTIANQKAIASLTTARPELSEVTRGASMGSAPLRCSPFLSYPAVETKLVDGRAANGDTALPDEPRLWPHCECGRAFTTDLPSLATSASTS